MIQIPVCPLKQHRTTVFGTKVEVPRDLDILVAGFVCKDFSTLNNYKKNLEERGESGDTFFSILEYIVAARPKMVLFENVKNAPWSNEAQRTKFKERLRDAEIKKMKKNRTWNRGTLRSKIPLPEKWEELFVAAQRDKRQTKTQYGIDAMMQDIGYVAKHLDLDTKDYYLPQTRQRGYMLCIDGRWFNEGADVEDGRDVQKVAEPELEKWASMVEALKHEASVPAEMMLLAASSETKTSILLPEKPGGETWERDWTKCRIRHTKSRDTYQLEDKRQLTNWKESGGKLLPDFWTTTRGMTNRVMDLLEIVHLLSLMHRIDDRYYRYASRFTSKPFLKLI
jgi:site-specific DNA-cytosine methylase